MLRGMKIMVISITLLLIANALPLFGHVEGNEGTRAGIIVNTVGLWRIAESGGFYALGRGGVLVNYTLDSQQTNVNVSVEVTPPSGPGNKQESWMLMPQREAGDHEHVQIDLFFNEEGQYSILTEITTSEAGTEASGPHNFNFKNVTSSSVSNLTLPVSPKALSGQYGWKIHLISVDLTNDGNVEFGNEDGIDLNISITSGGSPEDVTEGVNIPAGMCPFPEETLSLMTMGMDKMFMWYPSKEGTFDIDITMTDLRTSDTDDVHLQVVIKNVTVLEFDRIDLPAPIVEGQEFNVEALYNTTGTNCESIREVKLDITDASSTSVRNDTVIMPIEGGTAGSGVGLSFSNALFMAVSLLVKGTYTATVTVVGESMQDTINIVITEADNDLPVVEDVTSQSLANLKLDENITFKLKFTDTKWIPKLECHFLLDDDESHLMVLVDDGNVNYSAGEVFQYVWQTTGGNHTYRLRGSDGLASVETDPVDFRVADLSGDEGLAWGYVEDQIAETPIGGATISIIDKDNDSNTYEVISDSSGRYQHKLVYGNYKIEASKPGYHDSGPKTFALTDRNFEIQVEVLKLMKKEGGVEYGDLIGTVKAILNGSDVFLAGASVLVDGEGLPRPMPTTTANGTGKYELFNIPVGEYNLSVSFYGYVRQEMKVTISVGQNREDFTLEKIDSGGDGEDTRHLRVKVSPKEGVEVYFNGELLDFDPNGTYSRSYLIGYEVEVIIKKEGYKDEIFNLTIAEGMGLYMKYLTIVGGGSDDDTFEDTDKDGLPDSWEMQYFGNLNETATGDFDNDSYNNLEEYTKSTDPKDAKDHPGADGNGGGGSGGDGTTKKGVIDTWVLVAIGAVVVIVLIAVLLFFLLRKKGDGDDDDDDDEDDEEDDEEYEEVPAGPGSGPAMAKVSTSEMTPCIQCGTVVPAGTTFCPQCGNNLTTGTAGMIPPGANLCKGCANPIQAGTSFCPNCGMTQQPSLGAPAQETPQLPPASPPPSGAVREQRALPPASSQFESLDDLMSDATVSNPPLPPPPA